MPGWCGHPELLLRERLPKPEFVENFRVHRRSGNIWRSGFRTVNEAVGQAAGHRWHAHRKAHKLDLAPGSMSRSRPSRIRLYRSSRQITAQTGSDQQLIVMSRGSTFDSGKPVRFSTTIGNVNRTVGTMLGHEPTKAYGGQGWPDGTIDINAPTDPRETASEPSAQGNYPGCTATPMRLCRRWPSGGRIGCGCRMMRRRIGVAEDNIIGAM